MASPGNRHCANCIGTFLFPTTVQAIAAVLLAWILPSFDIFPFFPAICCEFL